MGCGCSSCRCCCCKRSACISPLVDIQKPVERLPSPIPPRAPLPKAVQKSVPKFKRGQLQEKVYEDFIVVWLNPSANDDDPTIQETEEQLQELVNVVITYADPNDCQAFIENIKDEKIFLVVSGTTVEEFAPKVQQDSQIESIYCLSSEEEAQKIEEANIPGLAAIFSNVPLLCETMKVDKKISGHNLIKPVVVENDSMRILYMYDQLFKNVILNSEENNLEELYQFCETRSSDHEKKKEYVKDLRDTYSNDKSIYWYTREGCLYKLLNRALRMHEYETLYELRVFIRHLHKQLLIQRKQTKNKIPPLYRGQVMETTEFDCIRNNKGKPTFFPSFFSTSVSRATAMWFAEKAANSPKNKGKVKVLFKIKVDPNIEFPFANITKLSHFQQEEEWLFSMGSVFHIEAIETLPDKTELINLTLINYSNKELKTLEEHFQNLVNDRNICLNFARLLHQMGSWKESKEFYEKSLKQEAEYSRQAAIYNNLGSIVLALEEHDEALKNDDEALKNYEKSLELEQKEENSNKKDLASTYNNVGTVYFKRNEIEKAIENFQRAIAIYNDDPNGDLELIATIYNNIATVLNHQGRHELALANNKRCLRIRKRIFPRLHPSLAIAYNSIATTYYYLQFVLQDEAYAQKAVDYAGKAVHIDNQSLPPDHPQTKLHEENLKLFSGEETTSKQ